MTFIDVHAHLDFYSDEEIEKYIENARKAGVKIIVNSGVDVKRNRKTLELAEKYPEVKISLGLYPIDALSMTEKEIDSEIDFIRKNKNKIVWIGEIGLDYKESQDKEKQKKIFQKLIDLAKEINKPILVHTRKAEAECIDFLEQNKMKNKQVIMHGCTGKLSLIKKIIENGWYLTIPTNVKNSEHFQKVVELAPITQLLCETDTPFLHPDKLKNNEPANVIAAYQKIAEIKRISLKEAETQVEDNYSRITLE